MFDERCSKLRKIAGVTPFVPWFKLSFYRNTDCKVPCPVDPAAMQFIPHSPPPHCPRFCRLLPQGRHGHQDKITMQYAYGTSGYALVSHHLIAHAAFVRKRNSWCSARCLPALLKTNAAFRFHFERCNPHFLFSVLSACQVFFCCVLWH